MSENASSHSSWHRLRMEHLNLKMNETECVTLNSFRAVTLPNGLSRLIFLGNKATLTNKLSPRELDLMYVDIDPLLRSHDLTEWNNLINEPGNTITVQTNLQEDLLHERKRLTNNCGVTSFEIVENRILYSFGKSGQLQYADLSGKMPLARSDVPTDPRNSNRTDPKLCPGHVDLMAFFRNGDLWLQDLSISDLTEVRLTNEGEMADRVFAGFPSYVILEEFDRYSGFYWQRGNVGSLQRIAYEVTDERKVENLTIVNPVAMAHQFYAASGHKGKHRSPRTNAICESAYPSAGSTNPTTELRFLEIDLERKFSNRYVTDYKLRVPIKRVLDWVEYIIRYEWIDGGGIWAQVLNREQNKSALLYLPLDAFEHEDSEITVEPSPIYVLHQWSSEHWIMTTKSFHFFPLMSGMAGDRIEFIFTFESVEGFDQLFYVSAQMPQPQQGDNILKCETLLRPITTGRWQVAKLGITVDVNDVLVYFQGSLDSPVENHLYCVSYGGGSDRPVTRLSRGGHHHTDVYVSLSCNVFISTFSSIQSPPVSEVYRLRFSSPSSSTTDAASVSRYPIAQVFKMVENQNNASTPEKRSKKSSSRPQLFKFKNAVDVDIYGVLYLPENYEAGNTYPTICYVYGGPDVQLVKNTYKLARSARHLMYTKFGYAVVAFDNRGSANRGLQFEGQLKGQLGKFEIDDQVAGLNHVARTYGVIDLTRVAIEGWSYGGYMALMCLAKRPQIFKLAIAGAPVTDWKLYDTAYTERYLGLPVDNPEGYQQSSVLHYIEQFPAEPNRLLIFHGMIDENVLFYNTTQLIEKLTQKGKPYDFKIFPQERHSIRSNSSINYYELTVLNYLADHL